MGILTPLSGLSSWLVMSLPASIRRSLLVTVNSIPEPRGSLLYLSIPEAFERQAAKFATRLAVKDDRGSASFAEVNDRANRLARAILAQLGVGEEAVALLVQQGNWSPISLVGTMKAGKFCIPMDPSHPVSRLRLLLKDSGARLIVTDGENAGTAREIAGDGALVLDVDELGSELPVGNLGVYPSPDSVAYILYTSGSTGQPKGVIQTHRSVMYQTARRSYRALARHGDKACLLTAQGYVASSGLIFSTLLTGITILPYDVGRRGVSGLAEWVAREEISVYYSVPTLFRAMMENAPASIRFPKMRIVSLGGEPMRKSDLELYKQCFPPHCFLVFGYGSTEAPNMSWNFITKKTAVDGNLVPIGHPYWGCDVHILDDEGKPVAPGEVGEIAASSPALSEGYWKRPDLTQERFKRLPNGKRGYFTGDLGRFLPDGQLLCLGRKDSQVKVRGHRIEPAEVEMVLLEHPEVSSAVVVGRKDPAGEMQLVAYVSPRPRSRLPFRELTAFLRGRLPEHMVPSLLVRMIALPTLPNGKVDLVQLPQPDWARNEQRATYIAPRTPIEERVVAIWSEILEMEQIGIHDDFAELGGNSLLATRVASRLADDFQVELPLAAILGNPTVEQMARSIAERLAENAGAESMEQLLGELEQITDEEARTRAESGLR